VELPQPTQSLEDWCEELRGGGINPIQGVHYKEVDRKLYKNTNPASYTVVDTEAGWAARDLYARDHPNAADEALRIVYDTGARNARIANEAAKQHRRRWELLQKESVSDTRVEDSLVRYFSNPKRIDWYSTIREIMSYGSSVGYTHQHYKKALDRFVSHFEASLRPITENMGANEMATFLSNLTLPDSEFEIFEREISTLVRQPGQKIKVVMSKLRALAESLYKGHPPAEAAALVESKMINGLLAMTTGQTNAELQAAILACRRDKLRVSWEKLLEGVSRSEQMYGVPNIELPYVATAGRAVMNFNVITSPQTGITGVAPLVQTFPDLSWDGDGMALNLLGPPPPLFTQQPPPLFTPQPQPPPPPMQQPPPPPPMQQPLPPVAQLLALPPPPPAPQPQAQALSPAQAIPANEQLNLSNASSASWDSNQGGSLADQVSLVLQDLLTPQRHPRGQNLESSPLESAVSVTRSGRPIRPPDDRASALHHLEVRDDFVDVLAAKIAAKMGIDKPSAAKPGAPAPGRPRSQSRDKSRSKSRDKQKSKSRDGSRDKGNKSGNGNRTASQDRAKVNNSDSRESRSRSKDGSKQNSNSRSKDRNDRPRSQSNDRSKSAPSKPKSRDPSSNRASLKFTGPRAKDWTDDEISLGDNCARNYDPSREKRCLKCLTENQHHEFQCPKFDRRSKFNCKNCKAGFHWPLDCDIDLDFDKFSKRNPSQPKGN
jgi:hypothetical protein